MIKDKNMSSIQQKVEDFLTLYYQEQVKGIGTSLDEDYCIDKMRNLIEKVAVWYELRYPDYEINKKMYYMDLEKKNSNDVMFHNNTYMKDKKKENLNWEDFYNKETFINSLPWNEKHYFNDISYNNVIYVDCINKLAHFHVTKDGFIEMSKYMEFLTKGKIKNEEVEGLHVKEARKLLKEKGIELSKDNELERSIHTVERNKKIKEGLLDSIMYRIMERGGNRVGPRRAFLFAKEFNRNINIPMMYGVDTRDQGLLMFVEEYLEAGGSKELVCDINYFSRERNNQKKEFTSIQNLIENNLNFEKEKIKTLEKRI